MQRFAFLAFGLSLLLTNTLAQTPSTDPQTLQALLTEVRQLRQDLQAGMAAVQRSEILLHRLEMQEAAVARALVRRDEQQSKLAEAQHNRKDTAARIKEMEEELHSTENVNLRREIEGTLPQFRARLEMWGNEEEQRQGKAIEAEEKLRIEETIRTELQKRLDELDKQLEKASLGRLAVAH